MGHLITGSSGTPHITPKSDSVWHRGMMGVESCILDFGEKLAPALVPSQPTNIRILDGCGMMQGRFFEIEEGSYDTIAIPNGAQGYNRIDLVCAKITQNENGTQSFSWEVVQGTQTSGTPTPPAVAEHSLDDGDEYALMPIASVELEGVSIVAVETVAEIGKTVDDAIKGVVDYIVERGNYDYAGIHGEYTKWNSGKCELAYKDWGTSFNAGATFAGGYYHSQVSPFPLPSFCANWKLISATPVSAQLQWVVGVFEDGANLSVALQNGTQAYISGTAVHLALTLEGTWK